jgi:hypothetical protein
MTIKYEKPCCSVKCGLTLELVANWQNPKKLLALLTEVLKEEEAQQLETMNKAITPTPSSPLKTPAFLQWNTAQQNSPFTYRENNTHVFIKEKSFVFYTAVTTSGFSEGVNYWEIVLDPASENEQKVGITANGNIDAQSAFCDFPNGWGYYGTCVVMQGLDN